MSKFYDLHDILCDYLEEEIYSGSNIQYSWELPEEKVVITILVTKIKDGDVENNNSSEFKVH